MRSKLTIRLLLLSLSFSLIAMTVFGQVFDNKPEYPKYAPELLKQDLDFVFRKYGEVHPDFYKETPKDTVLKRLEALKLSITKPMTRMDFISLFAPVLFHVVKDGHNYVNGPDAEIETYKKNGGLFFPLPVNMRAGRIYCNSLKTEIPFNAEIVSINEVGAGEVVKKLLSGYNAESEYFAEVSNSPGFCWMYWERYGGYDEYRIEYVDGGKVKSTTLKGLPQDKLEELTISVPQKNYAFHELPEHKTGVIQFNVCDGLEGFKPFCDSVFTIMKGKKYEHLVIDMRENMGGTTRLGEVLYGYLTNKAISQFDKIETRISKEKRAEFVEMNRKYGGWFQWYDYLYYPIYIRTNAKRRAIMTTKEGALATERFKPKKPEVSPLLFNGKVYLLTSEKTYSAAAIFAATLKHYKLATLVGQETEETTSFTANTVELVMPNTKLSFSISCARIFMVGWKDDGHGVIPDQIIKRDDNSTSDQELGYVLKEIKSNKANKLFL
ncbi:S41 family peptidase [Pedobacter sp. PWIIR3]